MILTIAAECSMALT